MDQNSQKEYEDQINLNFPDFMESMDGEVSKFKYATFDANIAAEHLV